MFKDKHVTVALLVAPILAVIAWYGVDQIVAEKPQAAQPGETYTLLARSNCRYDSGQCDLENADIKLSLRGDAPLGNRFEMQLESSVELQGATLGLVQDGREFPPATMTIADDNGMRWAAELQVPSNDTASIRIAVLARDSTWYAEVPAVFLALDQ